jgi:hypothetical protein
MAIVVAKVELKSVMDASGMGVMAGLIGSSSAMTPGRM